MSFRDFVYSLRKILTEEIPSLDFHVRELPEGSYRIEIHFPLFNNTLIVGLDNLKTAVEVYIRDKENYKNLGRFEDPQDVFHKIEDYLYANYDKEIQRLENLDFFYCVELKDFLDYNDVPVRLLKGESPKLVINFPDNLNTYTIEFSEYKESVLAEIIKTVPTEDGKEKEEVVYSVEIQGKDPQKAFTSLLSFLRREEK